MKHFEFIVLLTVFCSSAVVLRCEQEEKKDKENDSESDVFVPTSDWQPLRKDQPIPRGLHVRMNLNTGEREAKLLDPDDTQDDKEKGLSHVSQPDYIAPNSDKFSWEELKDALHKMEDKTETTPSQEDIDRVRRKFRSYSELKKQLGEVKLGMKTELEVISQLLNEYKETVGHRSDGLVDKKDLEHEEGLLSHLEYLVHQTDNANHFMKFNGIKDVVFNSLNSTSWRVRYEATKLFGSAVQSNPKVQIGALEVGAVSVLLRTLVLDPHAKVKSGALYAISCLIRWFPVAQAQFLEKGGLQALVKQFDSDTSEQLKIQMKALNLINDLITEITETENSRENELQKTNFEMAEAKERTRQQKVLRLRERLVEEGWCEALMKALSRHTSDVELVELLAQSMINMADLCTDVFASKSSFLGEMADKYKSLIGREEHDYMWIHALFTKLNQLMTKKMREEL